MEIRSNQAILSLLGHEPHFASHKTIPIDVYSIIKYLLGLECTDLAFVNQIFGAAEVRVQRIPTAIVAGPKIDPYDTTDDPDMVFEVQWEGLHS